MRGSIRALGLAGGSTGLMVDILDRDDPRQFGVCGVFRRFAPPRPGRSEPAEDPAAIDEANVHIAKPYDMITGLQLGNADELSDERFADEDGAALPHDLTGAAHPPDLMIGIIPRVLDAIRE